MEWKEDENYEELVNKVFAYMEIGKCFHIYFNKGNLNNKKIHILAHIEDQIVYKHFGKHKQKWFYIVDSAYYFFLLLRKGAIYKNLKQIKNK